MNAPFLFAQAAAPAASVQAAPAAAPAAPAAATETQPAAEGAAPQQQSGFGMLVPMLLIFALFYFMMIRPQQRKEKERRKMIEQLRAGAKVIFAGGILGTIVEAKEKTFVVETVEGRMEVDRNCVQGLVETASAEAGK